MNDEEKKLRKQQENALAVAASKALDKGDAVLAVSLIEQTSESWQANLVTLMGVIGFHSTYIPLRKRALALFYRHLKLCTNINGLTNAALWLRNPKRTHILPVELRTAIDGHRKTLEPNWDGVWHDGGLLGTNKSLAILAKRPEEVFDTNDCLIAANQSANWDQWVKRYHALGGNNQDPKYLKLLAAKVVSRSREPSHYDKVMLRKFTALGTIPEVRSFLRNITPVRRSLKGRDPNRKFAEYALFLYCECERLEHTIEDWVHISKSALHLDHRMVGRIAQRVLAGLERDSDAEQVFKELVRKNGEVRVTQSAREDIGPRGNPIWQSVYTLFPINADAKKILAAYSRREMDS